MLIKTGFTHNNLLRWQNEYAGRSLNVNGSIMRDTYTAAEGKNGKKPARQPLPGTPAAPGNRINA